MRPDHVTADRLDRVAAGQFVNVDAFTLTGDVPEDGWVQVTQVDAGVSQVMLMLADETTFTSAGNRLVRIGWND